MNPNEGGPDYGAKQEDDVFASVQIETAETPDMEDVEVAFGPEGPAVPEGENHAPQFETVGFPAPSIEAVTDEAEAALLESIKDYLSAFETGEVPTVPQYEATLIEELLAAYNAANTNEEKREVLERFKALRARQQGEG